MSPNPSSCIWTRVYWIWKQVSLRRMILIGSMLLHMLRQTITRRRPIICSMREKHWRRYEPLPISGYIFMVCALVWWLIISRYGGSWSRISLLASSLGRFYCFRSKTLRWCTVLGLPTWMQMDSHAIQVLRMRTWLGLGDMKIMIERQFQVGTRLLTSLYFLVWLLRFRYRVRMMRLIDLKLL